MRVLLAASLGGAGHLTPVLGVASACRRLGHEVMLLVPPSLVGQAESSGHLCRVGEEPAHTFVDAIWSRVRAGPPEAVAGLIDRELFADRCTGAMLAAAREARDSWQPDLIIREPCEYASAVIAQEAGLAQIQVAISLARLEWDVLEMVRPIIDRYAAGLTDTIASAPYLSSFPAKLDPSPWPGTRRFQPPAPPRRALPPWWPGDDRPLVYVTLGSVTGHLPEALGAYRTVLAAIGELPARILLTVGRGFAPDRLGRVPGNIHVEQWVAQGDVLGQADLVICHGGSGTTYAALGAGVPLVICPLFADQARNARLVQSAGAGLVVAGANPPAGGLRELGPGDEEPLRRAAELVLAEASYRQAAMAIRADTLAAPSLEQVLEDQFRR